MHQCTTTLGADTHSYRLNQTRGLSKFDAFSGLRGHSNGDLPGHAKALAAELQLDTAHRYPGLLHGETTSFAHPSPHFAVLAEIASEITKRVSFVFAHGSKIC